MALYILCPMMIYILQCEVWRASSFFFKKGLMCKVKHLKLLPCPDLCVSEERCGRLVGWFCRRLARPVGYQIKPPVATPPRRRPELCLRLLAFTACGYSPAARVVPTVEIYSTGSPTPDPWWIDWSTDLISIEYSAVRTAGREYIHRPTRAAS
jgi:hypothetical protein